MNDAEALKQSVEREVADYTEYLRRLKLGLDIAPAVSGRLKEAEAKLVILNVAPPDFIAEIAPRLLAIQREDDTDRGTWLPALPDGAEYIRATNSSGTSSDFYQAAITPFSFNEATPQWLSNVSETYIQLADDKARSSSIPKLADALDTDLSTLFNLSLDSITKARHRLVGVDEAHNRMRGFIQALWASLTARAKRASRDATKPSSLERKKDAHRDLVAHALGRTRVATLKRRLDDADQLYRDLSPASKNMLSDDMLALDTSYTRWILLVEEILTLVARHHEGVDGAA